MLALLRSRNIKLTMTSNGLSVAALGNDELRAFHDLEFSLDYPTREEQDAQRRPGNWDLVHAQAERCRRLGVLPKAGSACTTIVMARSSTAEPAMN